MRIRKKQEELIEVVDREERKETLWYHFDDMALRNGILYLRGWHVSVDGPGEVRLTDASDIRLWAGNLLYHRWLSVFHDESN